MSTEQVSKLKEHVFGMLVALIVVGLAYTYAISKSEFIKVTNDTPSPIIGVKGEFIEYCRDIEYTRDSEVDITKILITTRRSNMIIIPLSSTTVTRLEGFTARICKTLFLEDKIPSGTWTLETYVKRKQFPFWSNVEKLKNIDIIVGIREQDAH